MQRLIVELSQLHYEATATVKLCAKKTFQWNDSAEHKTMLKFTLTFSERLTGN